jgi:pilus assembly protein Flp/PilA
VTECQTEGDVSGDVPRCLSSAECPQQAVVPVPVPVIKPLKGTEMLKALTKLQTRIATRDKGATAVEYGLLVALIAAVIVAIVLVLGRQVSTAFNSVSTAI